MKKLYLAFLLLLAFGGAMNAEEVNLLSNAYVHPAENYYGVSSYFYNVWSCYKGDGTVAPEAVLPNSYFSKTVKDSDGILNYYTNNNETGNQIQIPGLGSNTDFPADAELLVLKYENMENMNYVIPLNASANGPCEISGYVAGTRDASQMGFANTYSQVIFVATPSPSIPVATIETKKAADGTYYLEVKNENGIVLPVAYHHPTIGDRYFSQTMNLTPEHKYLAIYASFGTTWIGDIKLKGESMSPSAVEVIENEDFTAEEFYDLSGRNVKSAESALTPGIYICKKGNATRKIVIR